MWAGHFKSLLNAGNNTKSKTEVENFIANCVYMESMYVSPSEVLHIINNLSCGKSGGPDGLTAESLKYADKQSVCSLFSSLMSTMFVHGYIPGDATKVILIPLVKNRSGNVTDKENYRPIALASIFSVYQIS